MSRLIDVENLTLQFDTDEGRITAVDNVSFSLEAGEVMGLVGESGSGKSVTAKSLMKLNPRNAVYGPETRITLHSIGDQMVEQLLIHTNFSKAQAKEVSIEMLDRVGISDPSTRFGQYAFELSGGMRQRAMIAMALSTKPKLLIADEPTTALDVTIQAQVIDLMKDLVSEFGMGIVFITHDLGVIAQTADKVAVMYLGRLVEQGTVRDVIRKPAHPYTRGLLAALPTLDDIDAPLTPIPGDIPSPLERPSGCVYHTRCQEVIGPRCAAQVPAFHNVDADHFAACHLYDPQEGTT